MNHRSILLVSCSQLWRLLLSTALVTFATRSSAEGPLPPELTVEWSAPAGCPDGKSVRASIATLLGETSVKNGGGALSFRAVVVPSAGRFKLDMWVRSASGEEAKSIDAETCGMVADAFALVVAIAVDPNAGNERRATPALPREPAEPTAPTLAVTPTRATEPTPWAVGVLGAGSVGTLPFPGLGVGALGAVGERPRWELSLSYWPNRAASVARPSGGVGAVHVNLVTARPSVCVGLSARSLFEVCPAIEIGRIAGSSSGVSSDGSGGALWLAAMGGLAAHVPVTDTVSLRLRLDVGVPVFRPNFVIERSPSGAAIDGWRPLQVFGILSVAPELRLSPRIAKAPGM